MAAGFFDSVALANHNHTSTPGDGGVLSNLSVTGSVSATAVMTEAGSPGATAQDIPTITWAGLMALLTGN